MVLDVPDHEESPADRDHPTRIPPGAEPPSAVLFDFHGTLMQVEDSVAWVVAAAAACGVELDRLRATALADRLLTAGRAGGPLPQRVPAHLAEVWIDHAFPGFVAKARELGVPIRVISDGLDYAIHRILARYGLDDLPLAANHLAPAEPPRQWQLSSPFQADGCRSGTCKCTCVAQASESGARTLLIGDGASDFCAADRVDFVFAKHRLIEHCRAAGIPYVPITGFEDALEFLPQLLDGRLPELPRVVTLSAA